MRIVDPEFLAALRRRPCDICGAAPPSQVEHVFRRGQGSARQIDSVLTCLSICAWDHQLAENKPGEKQRLKELLARMNRMTPEDLQEWVWLIWRLPQGADVPSPRRIPGELDATKNDVPF